ncbi:hypothetical protein LOTGIDRAFT_228205 [Lottia gigantea]|uniref:BHLH domain-containing protein n=1 Tax=Lottia gigantea TaxID=225164 RepID=V4AUQ8_LOTGI|nr:hypothetical protein LOTGIDRAFT_228205 [Lottia gigantea]ESO97536.1 hypothetical protein LOTGIDRAFT_228205 [Lottia gigantea]
MSKRVLTPVRGLTPVRVRRRQSDAKWRASVASCYDTLKLVIPNANKLSKKKVSKALILQETERHINHLEYTLSQLFNLKAPELGKTVLWKEGETYHPASLNDIKSDFEEKQSEIFSQSSHGRRRYHLLSDIEGQLVDMTVNFEKLSIVTRIGNMVLQANRNNIQKGLPSTTVNNVNKNRTYYSHGLLDGHIIPLAGDTKKVEMLMVQNIDDEDDVHTVPIQLTPEKSHPALNNSSDPSMAALSDPYLNSPLYISETDVLLASPKLAKVTKQLNFSSSFESSTDFLEESATPMKTASFSLGFTPVKLPSESEEEEENERETEEDHSQAEIKEEDNLICLETFDTDDSCDVQTEKTPDNRESILESSLFHDSPQKLSCKRKLNLDRELPRHRREEGYVPKCRRRLESMFSDQPAESSSKRNNNLPIINGVFDKDADCSDFDGYFLFYHQMASQLEGFMSRSEIASPSVASMVSGLWNTMPKEDKDTLATLAQLQTPVETISSQSSLSDDLQELDVKPFNNHKNKEEEEEEENKKRLLKDCGLHMVPDDMDLGVSLLPDSDFYTFTRNTKSKETNDLLQEQGFEIIDDFQVVPEL